MNIGDVFRVYTTRSKTPKIKIAIYYVGTLAGVELFFWFNTDARRSVPAQMPVRVREAPGITRDCFLNCGQAMDFPANELQRAVHQGRASAGFRKRIAQTVEDEAKTLPTVQRATIAAALRKQ